MAPDAVWMSVFADGLGGGNPCPVVLGADVLTGEDMQASTAEFGAETAFVLQPRAGGDIRLRYFVPNHEMQMCVHATIAATVLLGRAGRLPAHRVVVESPLGPLGVTWDRDSAVVDQFAPVVGAEISDLAALTRVAEALRTKVDDVAGPVRSVSTARAKLMIPLPAESALDALEPDYELLWQVCDELDVTGFYAFAPGTENVDITARQFPRRAGYVEDPATGVAAAALAAHLAAGLHAPGWHTWRIAQGRRMGRPSILRAEAERDVSGAVIATRVGGGAHVQSRDSRGL
ncbi:PhzF family phenazine biosynthesis protein [Jatrophihabitans sp. GAS493]|uniref:PhzF family phenazine biosynthesis protein n=1 Tax=Jatrophihabitans sp. GAS493 TaxID=1907575 RepID=UPI000BB901D8|nr:PhzF family phenazine biosynthesis protein [Jatrophihabitans sp. GAS493]SOD72581.1 PhzF family phenazine biosynthesis protein [Jatrophihabitans sp. GAS493]